MIAIIAQVDQVGQDISLNASRLSDKKENEKLRGRY
jgi:hypothetical protein